MARESIYERLQVGVETTPDTAIAASNQLSDTNCSVTYNTNDEDVIAQGNVGTLGSVSNKKYSNVSLSGKVDCVDLGLYWLSGLISRPSVSGNVATYKYNQSSQTSRNTFTFQLGNENTSAYQIAGVRLSGINITLSPNQASTWTATGFGQFPTSGITMTANPTRRPALPVGAGNGSLYLADSVAGLSSAKVVGMLAGTFQIESLVEPTMAFDNVGGYSFTTDTMPNVNASISVVKGTVSDAILNKYSAGTLQFAKILFAGPNSSQIEFIFPCYIKSPSQGEDANNIIATYTLKATYDATFGTMLQAKVTQSAVTGSSLTDVANASQTGGTAQPSQGTAGSAT